MKKYSYKITSCIALIFLFQGTALSQIFSEQSSAIGIDHSYIPRALMGGGAAFFDFDQDGDEDLYLNGGLSSDVLYQNNGDGSFTKMNNTAIGLEITVQYNTVAIIAGDIDNDGDRDLFISTWERFENGNEPIARNLLFENNGNGTFTEIGEAAGITQTAFSIGANFLDYNQDGFLDIHVINHIESPAFLYDNNGVIVGFDHDCYDNFFYRNNGDQTFTEIGATLGINDGACTLASAATDYDADGDVDLYLANDFGPFIEPNQLYQNNFPDESFSENATQPGMAIPMYGMGVAIGDYDHDQDLDYYITNLGTNVLLENENGQFTDVTANANVENTLANGSDFSTGWGTAFFDVNNDTWPDLYVSNGRIPSLSTLPTAMSDPNKLFLNMGDKTFSDITDANGVGDTNYGRGMAYADYDQDGDLDFCLVNLDELGGKIKFYRNDLNTDDHFVQLKLVGTISNRDAFGSKVRVFAGGETFLQEIDGGGSSFCSHHSSIAHFGLGTISQIDSVQVDWTNGLTQTFSDLEVDMLHLLEENLGTAVKDNKWSSDIDVNFFPNPFTSQLFFQTPNNEQGTWQLQLISAQQKIILEQEVTLSSSVQELKIESALPAGVYFVILKNDKQNTVKRLVKF